jgi:hypothetical protein
MTVRFYLVYFILSAESFIPAVPMDEEDVGAGHFDHFDPDHSGNIHY